VSFPDARLPRKLATRQAVRRTVRALLAEGDYGHLTYERIAATSGVAKTTLYRHWPSKAELVFDLVLHDRDLPSLADTGSVDADVAALADRLVAFVGDPEARRVFPGVIADVVADPGLRARFHESFVLGAQPELAPVIERITSGRGIVARPSLEDLQAVLVGSTFAWIHLGALSQDDARSRVIELIDALFPPTGPPPAPAPAGECPATSPPS
jgi:AcrR family transcriptional regulator